MHQGLYRITVFNPTAALRERISYLSILLKWMGNEDSEKLMIIPRPYKQSSGSEI